VSYLRREIFMVQLQNAEAKYAKLDECIDSLTTREGALITSLHKAQEVFGYLPEEVQDYVAKKLQVPPSKVYGVVTFYSYFSTKPKGKYQIKICEGTACFVLGSEKIREEFTKDLGIKAGETTEDGLFSIDSLRCVGACGLAPVVMVNNKVYGRLKPEDVKGIIEEYLLKGDDASDG
jgi:NADH-quinone oxidoreductase E subunit